MINIFIEKSKNIHGEKYDYSKVDLNTHHREKIIITCKEHGDFLQRRDIHLSGHGCKKCAIKLNKNRIPSNKSNTIQFIFNSNNIHGYKYDYSKVEYINSNNKVIIICNKHGEFLQSPFNHLNGSGFNICGKILQNNKTKLTHEEFIQRSIEKHGYRYDYSKVEYINSKTNVRIICREHGEFLQKPCFHYRNGHGCNICGGSNKSTTKEFIKKAIIVHNDKYDYSNVQYVNAINYIIIICRKHGDFLQTPNNHLRGKGCPRCVSNKYSSKQISWLNFISIYYGIEIQHALNGEEFLIKNTRYLADGYCKETNTIYEFHGDLWHGNPKLYNEDDITYFGKSYKSLYEKTMKKEKIIKDLGYNLVVMWENDWDRINRSIILLQKKIRKNFILINNSTIL